MEIISRNMAREAGLIRYFTGQPCKNGHFSERRVGGGHCIACVAAAQFAWRERLGPDGLKATQQIYDFRFKIKDPARKAANSNAANKRMLERDPEYFRRAAKRWRKENPEAFYEIQRRCVAKVKAENPLAAKIRMAASRATYRAKTAETLSPHGLSIIVRKLWDKCGGKCEVCSSTSELALDHVVAIANGGNNDEKNLQFLCATCNSSKGTKDFKTWLASRVTEKGVAA
jgi:5-methylcytosine-specific restriction endonuclease McrA